MLSLKAQALHYSSSTCEALNSILEKSNQKFPPSMKQMNGMKTAALERTMI